MRLKALENLTNPTPHPLLKLTMGNRLATCSVTRARCTLLPKNAGPKSYSGLNLRAPMRRWSRALQAVLRIHSFPKLKAIERKNGFSTGDSDGEQSESPSLYGVSGHTIPLPSGSRNNLPNFSGHLQVEPGHSDEEAAIYRD